MKEKILEALSQLDPLNDDHWTSDGAPRMDAVEHIVGDRSITRKDIVNAAPDFNREKASAPPPDDEEEEGTTETDTEAQENEDSSDNEQNDPELGANDEGSDNDEQEETDQEDDEERPALEIPTGMTEQEFVAWILKVHPKDLADVEDALKDQLNQIARGIEEARALMVRLRGAVTFVSQRIQRVVPGATNQEAIGDFIRAQAEARAAKVARRNEILKGVKPDELDPRAPIDAAMARKTKRGTQRPVRPILK